MSDIGTWLLSNLSVFWFGRYLTRRLICYLSQSSVKPSIHFSLFVKSLSNPFLKPKGIQQSGYSFLLKYTARPLIGFESTTDCEPDTLPSTPSRSQCENVTILSVSLSYTCRIFWLPPVMMLLILNSCICTQRTISDSKRPWFFTQKVGPFIWKEEYMMEIE